jgi:hypothetical protein
MAPSLPACRYADNILKTFAVGCSIVLNCIVSSGFLGVPLTLQLLVGVLLVVGSTCLFNARALRPEEQGSKLRGAEGDGADEEREPLTGKAAEEREAERQAAESSVSSLPRNFSGVQFAAAPQFAAAHGFSAGANSRHASREASGRDGGAAPPSPTAARRCSPRGYSGSHPPAMSPPTGPTSAAHHR